MSCCIYYPRFYLQEVVLDELIIRITSHKVNASSAKYHKQSGRIAFPVEPLKNSFPYSSHHELIQFLMRLLFNIINPVTKLSNTILLIVFWLSLEDVVVYICIHFRNSKTLTIIKVYCLFDSLPLLIGLIVDVRRTKLEN